MPDIGYYTLPVILSFKGIDAAVNSELGDKLTPAAKKAGEDYAKGMAEGVKTGGDDIGKATEEVITKSATKAAKPAGKKAGKEITKSTADAIRSGGDEIGKAAEDALGKAGTKAAKPAAKKTADAYAKTVGEQLKDVANDVAGEFATGMLDGVKKELGSGVAGQIGAPIIDELKKSAKDADYVEIGGNIVSGIGTAIEHSDEIKGAAGAFIDGLKEGMSGADISGAAETIVTGIKDTMKGGLDEVKGNVKEWVTGIADDIRSGDIKGAADEVNSVIKSIGEATGFDTSGITGKIDAVATSVGKVKHGLDQIKQGDYGGALQTTVDALKGLETLGVPKEFIDSVSGIAGDLKPAIDSASELKDTLELTSGLLGEVLPGKAGAAATKISAALAGITAPEWLLALLAGGAVVAVGTGIEEAHKRGLSPEVTSRFPHLANPRSGEPGHTTGFEEGPPKQPELGGLPWAQAERRGGKSFIGESAEADAEAIAKVGDAITSIPDEKTVTVSALSADAETKLKDLGFAVEHLPNGEIKITALTDPAKQQMETWRTGEEGKPIDTKVTADTSQAQAQLDAFIGKAAQGVTVPVTVQPTAPLFGPGGGKAGGGGIYGQGGPTQDNILTWTSVGEHVFSARDVNAMGGQANVYAFRNALHRADGGAIPPDVAAALARVGTPYSQANRNDCSGMVAQIINAALGLTGTGLMSTKSAKGWLAARGFQPGIGGRGQITVGWYDHGPNPNDGHMAMTLSDGEPAESGGSHGMFLGGARASSATNPQFDQHMFLPTLFGEGPAGSSSVPGVAGAGGAGGGGGHAGIGGGFAGAAASASIGAGGAGGGGQDITKQFAEQAKTDANTFVN